jgi:DNA replication licensing factor MCM2
MNRSDSEEEDDDVRRPRQRRRFDNDEDHDRDTTTSTGNRAARLAALAHRRRRQRMELEREVLELMGDNREDYQPVTTPTTTRRRRRTDDDDDDSRTEAEDDNEEYEADNQDDDGDNEEEEEGEDLMENMMGDYQRIEALDTYGTEGIDDTEYEAMDREARQAAEREIARRSQKRSEGFYGTLYEENDEDEEARQARRGMFAASRIEVQDEQDMAEEEEEEEEDLDGEDPVNLEAFDVGLREWIAQDRTRKEIQRRFRKFLKHFSSETNYGNHHRSNATTSKYEQAIRQMAAHNRSSIVISYMDLMESEPILAYWLADAPKDMLEILHEAATRHTLSLFPSYKDIVHTAIFVRIADIPILDGIRDLRISHMDCLVKTAGVVTRRSAVFPQLSTAYYQCTQCKTTQGPFSMDTTTAASGSPDAAAEFHAPEQCDKCKNFNFRLHPTLCRYRNFQRWLVQESPGSVAPGRVPRSKEVLASDDLIDTARPGELVEITGIYQHAFDASITHQSGFPVFRTYLTANHVQSREDTGSFHLSETDIRKIQELARDKNIGKRIVQSIAPSIFGHDFCKMALAMSMFGGVAKNEPSSSGNNSSNQRIRGDVNVLFLGDPGTAKSQLLKYAERTAPRAVYATGKGASAVGLTASVQKDPVTKEWTLEGGALVLADQGICCIDEFDKMNEQDRTSIHEAMEQQSISVRESRLNIYLRAPGTVHKILSEYCFAFSLQVSKAGIVTSLQARCAVIAAANPIGGRYDSANTLADNVELTDPILQRFDILCVLQDVVDPVSDERLATFVTKSHMRSVPTREWNEADRQTVDDEDDADRRNIIPQDLLRKYIQYARTHVRPVLRGNAFDQEKVASLYVALRRESAASGGVPIAVRHIESIMRMAEAHAKMHLREYVRDDDMDAAIRMMLGSFIDAQKFSVRRALKRSFAKFITSGEDRAHLLLFILQDLFRKEQLYQVIRQRQRNLPESEIERLDVPLDELEGRARERRIYDVSEFCQSAAFREAGYVLDAQRGIISRAFVAA